MTVAVKFEDRAWGRLATMADAQGITVPALLERAAGRLLTGTVPSGGRRAELAASRKAHKQALTSQIVRLRSRGKTIAQIADLVGYSTTYVSKILTENDGRTWQRSDAQNGQERKTA